ncbi:MAG: FG-GAP-like repeat-containing protein [Pyrinomonadaceae bacterium]
MKNRLRKIKSFVVLSYLIVSAAALIASNSLVQPVKSFSTGPPAGFSSAPGESSCTACHVGNPGPGQFTIIAPVTYAPGQTYQVQVRQTTNDTTRRRWGFQLTSLAGLSAAGTFSNLSTQTQTLNENGRFYIEHTLDGSFGGQLGGAQWTFNWIAPSTNVGPVTFYSAGNQANNDGTSNDDFILTATATVQPSAPPVRSPFDFDGDGKTDISIFRPGPGEWWYQRSSDGQVPAGQFGASTDKITPGDFTGDGKTDIAFWRPSSGEWFVLRSEDGSFFSFPFGAGGDVPMPADYDADGKADAAVFRPSTSTWFILNSSGTGTTIVTFGTAGDKPVAADYDGDAKADIAIFRPSDGSWWYLRSSDGQVRVFSFGVSTDKAVPGDFTGDGKADIAVWRPSTGFWFVQRSEDNSFFSFPFGTTGDVPVPGDYDGDGRFDAGVFRPTSTTWFVQRSTAGILIQNFGLSSDTPIPSAFVP